MQSDTEKHGNTKYTKIVGKIEKKCRKGLDFKMYLNDTLIPEGNIREEFQDGKSKKVTLSGMLFAIGLILPFFIGQIPAVGKMLLPMHIPVLLCGLACGWPYGLVCGLLGPVLSGVLTGMPSPAVLPGMMVECGVYGLVSGLMMQAVHTKKLYADLYISQITAMLLGRILSGVCKALIFAPATFTVAAWATTSFVTGLPGIVIQLVLLPTLVVALTKARLLRVRYA